MTATDKLLSLLHGATLSTLAIVTEERDRLRDHLNKIDLEDLLRDCPNEPPCDDPDEPNPPGDWCARCLMLQSMGTLLGDIDLRQANLVEDMRENFVQDEDCKPRPCACDCHKPDVEDPAEHLPTCAWSTVSYEPPGPAVPNASDAEGRYADLVDAVRAYLIDQIGPCDEDECGKLATTEMSDRTLCDEHRPPLGSTQDAWEMDHADLWRMVEEDRQPTWWLSKKHAGSAKDFAAPAAHSSGNADEVLARLSAWTHEYGAALKPTGADTYGEGVRACKAQVAAILAGQFTRVAGDAPKEKA